MLKNNIKKDMFVYKYRSDYSRDIDLLSKYKIYASSKLQLNDPFEGIIKPKILDDYEVIKHLISPLEYEKKLRLVKKLIEDIKFIGIYSLSEKWNDELLWSHYADSHKGFCIEFNINEIIQNKVKRIIFPEIIKIRYRKEPPTYSLSFMENMTYKKLLKILIGTKSKSWKHEDEIRILFNELGFQEINSQSIKSIIFGVNASEKNIQSTIEKMGDKIMYYKICINKYNLKKIEI